MKDFIAFLDVRRCKNWARKISSWKYLRPVLPDFPEHRVPHFWSPFWAPFRGCWRSATAAVHNLILVEVDGKCSWQVPISSWQCPWPNYLNSQGFSILLGEKDHVTFLEGIAMRIWDQEYTLDPRHYAMGKRETSGARFSLPEAAAVWRSEGGEGTPITMTGQEAKTSTEDLGGVRSVK